MSLLLASAASVISWCCRISCALSSPKKTKIGPRAQARRPILRGSHYDNPANGLVVFPSPFVSSSPSSCRRSLPRLLRASADVHRLSVASMFDPTRHNSDGPDVTMREASPDEGTRSSMQPSSPVYGHGSFDTRAYGPGPIRPHEDGGRDYYRSAERTVPVVDPLRDQAEGHDAASRMGGREYSDKRQYDEADESEPLSPVSSLPEHNSLDPSEPRSVIHNNQRPSASQAMSIKSILSNPVDEYPPPHRTNEQPGENNIKSMNQKIVRRKTAEEIATMRRPKARVGVSRIMSSEKVI